MQFMYACRSDVHRNEAKKPCKTRQEKEGKVIERTVGNMSTPTNLLTPSRDTLGGFEGSKKPWKHISYLYVLVNKQGQNNID